MELFIFYSLYELFFEIILFYSLCESKNPDLLILQTIIRKRDVILQNSKSYLQMRRHNYKYQELSVGRKPIKTEIAHIANNNIFNLLKKSLVLFHQTWPNLKNILNKFVFAAN